MMAAARVTKLRKKIGKGTRGSFLPTYSMLLSFIFELLPPRVPSESETGLFEGDSEFLVGMDVDNGTSGGFELSDTRITPGGRISLCSIFRGRNTMVIGIPKCP
jgi:hypothetical protein